MHNSIEEQKSTLVEKMRDIMQSAPQKPLASPVALLLAAVAITTFLLFFLPHESKTFTGSNHSIVGEQVSISYHSGARALRQWSDVPAEERKAIKQEAMERFPQIGDIGSGTDWRPVALWLAEEKAVAHSNPRDLFRGEAAGR